MINVQSIQESSAKPSIFRKIAKLFDSMSAVLAFFGGTLLCLSGFIITFEVISRYVFDAPTHWTDEVSTLFVLTAIFTTISFGLREGSHVMVKVLFEKLPDLTQKMYEALNYFLVLVFSTVFVIVTFQKFLECIRIDENSAMCHLPVWPIKGFIFLGFLFLALQALKFFVQKMSALPGLIKEWKHQLNSSILSTAIFILLIVAAVFITFKVHMTVGVIMLLLVLLIGGTPIGFTLGIVASIGSIALLGFARGLLAIPQTFYITWNTSNIIALPMFVFLGYVLHKTGLASDLFAFCRVWFGGIPGGMAVATIVLSAIFAAVSGSSMANAITIGLIAYPAMVRYKYDPNMAAGLIAVGGTLGVLIPPSTAFLMIGVMTNESIGELFMAGIVPGVIASVLLSIVAIILCVKTGKYEPMEKIPLKEKLIATKKAIGILLLPIIMLGGIYTGIFTPTEASGVSVVYAIVFALLSRRIKPKDIFGIISESTKSVSMIGLLVAAGTALSNVTAMLRVPQIATEWVLSTGWPGWAVVIGTLVLVFILGMFLDAGAITILIIPILFPMITALGFSMTWYAVIFVLCTEIGLITPPVGMNAFVMQQVTGLDLLQIIKGSIWFLIVLLVTMILVGVFPQLALWLPSTM